MTRQEFEFKIHVANLLHYAFKGNYASEINATIIFSNDNERVKRNEQLFMNRIFLTWIYF